MFPLSLIPCDFSSSRLPVPLTRLMHIAGGLVEQGSFAKPAHRGDIYDGKSFVLVVLQHFPLLRLQALQRNSLPSTQEPLIIRTK